MNGDYHAYRFFTVSVPRVNTIGVEGVHPWCQGLVRITLSNRIEVVSTGPDVQGRGQPPHGLKR